MNEPVREEVAIQPTRVGVVVVDQDGDTWEFGQGVGMWRCTTDHGEDPLTWDELRSEYGPLYLQEEEAR